MTWGELAEENRAAAQTLGNIGHHRAACGRAYYAVYAALASTTPRGFAYPKGWKNPGHDQLFDLLRATGSKSREGANQARKLLRRLQALRVDADYRPGLTIGAEESRAALRAMNALLGRSVS